MKYPIIILLILLPISAYGKSEGGCYFSVLAGRDSDSAFYKGGELGCEGSMAKNNWLGGYLGLIFLGSNKSGKEFGGINFGARKNFIFKFTKGYQPLMPYVGFGGIVTFTTERQNESGSEYKKVNDIKFYSFTPNAGIKIPITRSINIIPNVRYVMAIRKEDSSVFTFGVSLRIGRGK